MTNEIVTGAAQPVEPARSKGKYCLFDTVTIELDGGGQRVLTKASAASEVAAAIRRRGKGQFYLSTYGGQTGFTASGSTMALRPMPITTTWR